MKVFEAYLPKQMNDEELTVAIKAIIERVGATTVKEMGKVMVLHRKSWVGKVEGRLILRK